MEHEPEYVKSRKETHQTTFFNKLNTRIQKPVHSFLNAIWKGASYGAIVMTMVLIFSIGFDFHTGLGKIADALIFLLIALPGTLIMVKIATIVVKWLTKLPALFIGAIIVSSSAIIYTLDQFRALDNILPLAYTLIGVGAVGGGLLGYPLVKGFKKPLSIVMLVSGLTLAAAFFYWMFVPGWEDSRLQVAVESKSLKTSNPAEPGPYSVKTFTYGSGTDKQREEFGENVDFKTMPVNASAMIGEWSKEREWFWGFKDTNVPLNGRVWMPEGNGTFPLVLIVHGNHKMEDFSDEGYNYLGELLASRGFTAISVDENFLNSSWSGGVAGDINGRAWLLLQHIEEIETLSNQKNNPFYGKVDLDEIALIGHSRGGQAAILAAKFNELDRYPNNASMSFDFHYNIQTVIALAPTDYQTLSDRKIEVDDVNYLLLQGSYDSDLSEFEGDRQYNGVHLTGKEKVIKSALYVDRANHGQFNTTWGENDTYFPFTLLLNKEPMLDGQEQQQIAKTYVAGFLEATLHKDDAYRPMFEDYRYALDWLPDTSYISKYEDPSYNIYSDYEEDVDPTTASSPYIDITAGSLLQWYEGELEFRRDKVRDNHGVFLKWNQSYSKNGHYTLNFTKPLQDPFAYTDNSALTFTAANTSDFENQIPIDFTITVTSTDGESASVKLSDVMPMQGVLPIQHTKTIFFEKGRYGEPTEPVLQTFNIPMSRFTDHNRAFDPAKLASLSFQFNASESGSIYLDHIGVNHAN
ncbi:MAG: hypothetical protein WBV93_20700 [Anaerobacillus sp.]